MADEDQHRTVEPVMTSQHYSARELRTQSVLRLQVGLFGLCAMLLLVGLANVILDRAQHGELEDSATEEVIAVDAPPKKPASDPLADIGVAPSADPLPELEPEAHDDLLGAE